MVLLLTVGKIYGQQAAITIIDAKTKEAVPFATVCFGDSKSKNVKFLVTDMSGKVPNNVKETSAVTVTFVGYVTLVDSIKRGVSATFSLIPAVLNMDEVVITAQYAPEKADKSIYKINVINSRQIEQKASTNLADLLSTESNMRLSQGGVLGSSLSMQGLTGENVKFLIDGVPVVGRLNGNIDLSQLCIMLITLRLSKVPCQLFMEATPLPGLLTSLQRKTGIHQPPHSPMLTMSR